MASCACEQFFGRLRWLPQLTGRVALEEALGKNAEEILQPVPSHAESMLETVRSFIDRRCTVDEHRFVSVNRLWLAWKEDIGHDLQFGPSLKRFAVLLRHLGFKLDRGRSFYSITGLGLDQPVDHDKLLHDLSLARHDAVMAEAALRAHLANNSLAAVPAEGLDALVAESARIVGRCRETLETLARLSDRAKALGVQS